MELEIVSSCLFHVVFKSLCMKITSYDIIGFNVIPSVISVGALGEKMKM
jgi:hypothetical protein